MMSWLEEAGETYAELERKQALLDAAMFQRVKVIAGKKFYAALMEYIDAMKQDAGVNGVDLIQRNCPPPTEYKQKTSSARIPYEWVDQWSVGDSGDSFQGHIFIPIKGKYWLKMYFSA